MHCIGQKTGGCDELNVASGSADGDEGKVSVRYRYRIFADNVFDEVDYISCGLELPLDNGNVIDFACYNDADWLLMPLDTTTSSTYIPDYYSQNWGNPTNKVVQVGGGWYHSNKAGLFSWGLDTAPAYAPLTVGARLLYIPK